MKKLVSLFLVFAIVLSLAPVLTVRSASDGTLSEADLANDDIKLGKGFNVLAKKQLLKENVSTGVIFMDSSVLAPRVSGANHTEYFYTYINDANSYLKNQSSKMNMGVDVSVPISMVSVEASAKYGVEVSSSSSAAANMEYIALSVVASRKKYYCKSITLADKQMLWATDGLLNEEFKEEISMLQTDEDIAAFFTKYGTHIITAYSVGGEACYTYSGEKVETSSSMSVDENVSVSAGVSVGSFGSVKASVDAANHMDSSGATSTTGVSAYGYQKGGVGIPFKDTDVTAWEQTISDTSMEMLVNDSLQLMPIWDLLVLDSQADLKARLKNYFETQLGTGYNGVDNLMGKTDYSDYTFITNAQELDAIRNDLDGKYVLLCDIDLSGHGLWEPIGTSKDQAFNGILDGNGNTVTGLRVTQAVNGAAGFFGYVGGLGEVRNLTVEGTVDVDVTGAEDAVGYVGGIAGYSNGIIQNCRNYVRVNGTLTTDTSAVDSKIESTWFDTNQAELEAAKSASATTVEDGAVYDTFPLKLTGSGSGITISVSDSGRPAYIILEDAQITGTISSVSGNTRPICIISTGTANTFAAPDNAVAITAPNASVYVTGDAPLTIKGGDGTDGVDGAAVSGTSGSNGKNGANGTDGNHGSAGMIADKLVILLPTLNISGGSGGNGGHASSGTNGSDISGTCRSDYATSGSCRGATGGSGGAGGNGGNGGNGAAPVTVNGIIAYGESAVVMQYGRNGNGGNGGNGGKGGRGQNGANGWCVAGIEPGHAGGAGGTGGAGGAGGSAGTVQIIDYTQLFTLFHYSNITVDKSCIFSGIGGNGGTGGAGGAGGTGGAEIHNWFYDIGQHPGVAGNGGNGGKGGNGGNGGDGYQCGIGASAGAGGSAGSRGYTEDNCGRNGSPGAGGNVGVNGAITISDDATSKSFLVTNSKKYSVYDRTASWDEVHTLLNGGELVSIGSYKEQLLIEQLLRNAPGTKYWIGLYRNSQKGFNIFDWDDGTTLKIQEDTFGSEAVAALIGSNGEEICDAYSNWAPGQPDNANSSEKYICVDSVGAWFDTGASDTTVDSYITEETLVKESTNSTDRNVLFVGGICGFADVESEITGCINGGAIAGKATSEEYGVTACSGGIAGINLGIIRNSMVLGAVEAISVSNSSVEYSDACAAQIANVDGAAVVTNCYSGVEPVVYAISGSGLSNPTVVKDAAAGEELAKELESIWSNDSLRITAVDPGKTVYGYGDVFIKNSITVTYGGVAVSRFKVNYYFKNGATSANVVISYQDAVRIIPVKLIMPTIVDFKVTEAKRDYYYNDTFGADGLVASLYYNTGTIQSFTANSPEIAVTTPDMTKLGTQIITVTYADDSVRLQSSYEIEVLPAPLKGSVHIDGTAAYGQTLTVNLTGITTANPTYTVAWYKNDEPQPLSTAQSITVTESLIDQNITVAVTGIGYYQGTLVSEAVIPVRLDTDAPASLTVSAVTDTTVTLQLIPGAEYRCENGPWQSSNVFADLKPNTRYRFYARYAMTGTSNASSPSLPVYASTLKTEIYGSVTLPEDANTGDILTVDISGLVPGDANVAYQWYADGQAISGETGSSYTVKPSDEGKLIFVRVSGVDAYTGFVDSGAVEIKAAAVMLGDTNGDGKVNMKDWQMVYEYITEVRDFTEEQFLSADVTGDGKVNMKDWSRLYEHLIEVNPLF